MYKKFKFMGSHYIYNEDGSIETCQNWFLEHKNGNFTSKQAIAFVDNNNKNSRTSINYTTNFVWRFEDLPELLQSININFNAL